MLYSLPIYAVLVENLGERGAHYFSMKLFRELREKVRVNVDVCEPAMGLSHNLGIEDKVTQQRESAGDKILWMLAGATSVAFLVWLRNRMH